MNKLFFSIILFISIGINANAQFFQAGIVAGLLSSQVDGDMASGYNKAGFHGGVFVRYPLFQEVAGQLEMRFITKGALENRIDLDGYFYKSVLNYVEVPFTLSIQKDRFHFEAGPALGVLIHSREEDAFGDLSLGAYEDFRKIEISGIAGFFYDVTEDFVINFRFQYSFTPVRRTLSSNVNTVYRYQRFAFNNLMSFGMYYYLKK